MPPSQGGKSVSRYRSMIGCGLKVEQGPRVPGYHVRGGYARRRLGLWVAPSNWR